MARLNSPTQMLNDECVNTLGRVFLNLTGGQKQSYALFSSFLPTLIQNRNDEQLWNVTQKHEFWTKSVWIIPIHRAAEKHWVLSIVSHVDKTIFLFDSLSGSRSSWSENIKVSSTHAT